MTFALIVFIILIIILIIIQFSLFFTKLSVFIDTTKNYFRRTFSTLSRKKERELNKKINSIKKENERISTEILSLRNQIKEIINEKKELITRLEKANENELKQANTIADLNQENKSLISQNSIYDKNFLNAKNENETLKSEITQKDQEIEELNVSLTSLTSEIEKLYNENTSLKQDKEENLRLIEQFEYKLNHNYFDPKSEDFRKRFPKDYRCKDGDYVRSKAEQIIDDFLYENRIWHIFENDYQIKTSWIRKKYYAGHFYPDFYLPDKNLYIEYFGKSDEETYKQKKEDKLIEYQSNKNINFEYLTFEDDNNIHEKLKEICRKYNLPFRS